MADDSAAPRRVLNMRGVYLPGWRSRVVLSRRHYAGLGLDKRQRRGRRRRDAKLVWLAANVYADARARETTDA